MFDKVYLRDNVPCDIVRKGDFEFLLTIDSYLWLKKVRYVLNLRRNLISVGHHAESKMKTTFTGETCLEDNE